LNEVCNGNVAETSPQKDAGKRLPGRELIFVKFDDVLRFCSMLDARFFYDSTLYKEAEEYILLVDFAKCSEDSEAVSFILMAEEYDAVCREIGFDEAYLKEHGQVLLPGNAIEMLNMMSR
jgi:negative regulator of genetic competence, sporulation and motility